MERKKDHADFQDQYRKSSNFGKSAEDDKLKIKGDGDLKLSKDEKMKAKEEKRKISEALKKASGREEE